MTDLNAYFACLEGHGLKRTDHVLLASLGEKILHHWQGDTCISSYPISFSKRPLSCQEGSLGTPWGLHVIAAKHGQDSPPGMVFKGRVATGERWQDMAPDTEDRSLVTTRILRLKGLEPGLNKGPGMDSFDRYIYIHGTNHPERFPDNISAGCILMLDEPLMELFERVPEGSHVFISPPETGPPS
ncbi:MAG: L,D-transpeptidase [Puniceicoccaceae bacterium]